MASFLQQFAQRIRKDAPGLRGAFSEEARNAEEQVLKEAVIRHWHPLPALDPAPYQPTYAVDGSSAIRHLNNGWSVIISQALAVGPEYELPKVDVRFRRSAIRDTTLFRYTGLLMRSLELGAALEAAAVADGGVLCLDGSFQTDIPHWLYPIDIHGERDLPLKLLESYLDLLDACRERGIMLIGLSKTSTATFLIEAATQMERSDQLEPDVQLMSEEDDQAVPSDAEAIWRWTQEAGFSTPVVLGVYGFGHRRSQLVQEPEAIAGAFGGSKKRLALLRRLQGSSPTVCFYLRLQAGEEPLRVDVPAVMLGLRQSTIDFYLRWARPDDVLPALRTIVASYGGATVYNAAVYVADRLVRLSNQMVDGPYLSVIRQNLGQYVQYNRSQRRFF